MTYALPNEEKQSLIFNIAAFMTVTGAFTLPLFGNAAHNILLGLPCILLLFTRNILELPSLVRENSTALLSLLIFTLMTISLLWSVGDESTKILSKYRDFLFIPAFMLFFSITKYRHYTFAALYIALSLALFCSYLIHYDLVNITTNPSSLKNRIFHGITLSFFAYMSLQAAIRFKRYQFLFITMFILTLHNLFFIENGRTGYLLILSLSGLFVWQRFSWRGVISLLIAGSAIAILAFYSLGSEHIRILGNTHLIGEAEVLDLKTLQQIDVRAEYYLLATFAFLDNWIIGCGVGCFANAYELQQVSMQTYWPSTVNAHNEFLQIGVQTGFIGILLFCAFLGSIVLMRRRNYPELQQQFCVALFLLVSISCVFNSSFMDHGDGMYFMLLVALICGKEWKPN